MSNNKTVRFPQRYSLMLVGLLLFLMPMLTQDIYHIRTLVRVGMNVILSTSLWLILTTGQLNMAHGAFMAIGAYAGTLLVMKGGFPFWISVPLAGLIAVVISIAIGIPTLRLKGPYFFMVAFAFGEIVFLVLRNYWTHMLGGAFGIIGVPFPVSSWGQYYWVVLAVTILTVLIIYQLTESRIGSIWRAIEQEDVLAECIGIGIMRYKLIAFATGCFFAGIAGSFYGPLVRVINPHDFNIVTSIFIFINVLVGGQKSVVGPILGAVLLTILSELIRVWGSYENLVYGIALILVMLFAPGGIEGLFQRFLRPQKQND